MNVETIKKYKEYNFGTDAKWQTYLGAIYPVPPMSKIEKVKRKWYKNNVDQEFDPEVDLDAPAQSQSNNGGQQYGGNQYQGNQQAQPAAVRPFAEHKLFHAEGLLKIIFILGTFVGQFFPSLHFYLLASGFATCLLGIYRQLGRPEFNQEYLQAFLSNDFSTGIFYLISIATLSSRGPFIYLPVIMQFILGVAEFESRTEYVFLKYSKVQVFLEAIKNMKAEIRVAKAYAEFFNLFYFLLLIFLGRMTIMIMLIYINFLKFKYKLNRTSHDVIDNIRSFAKAKVSMLPGVGILLSKAVDGLFWLITF